MAVPVTLLKLTTCSDVHNQKVDTDSNNTAVQRHPFNNNTIINTDLTAVFDKNIDGSKKIHDLQSVHCIDKSNSGGVAVPPGPGASDPNEHNDSSTIYLIWKDVTVLSIGFLLNFIAFNGLSNLQSTLNSNEGLGTASLGVIYASLIISSFLLPPVMIKQLGCKWTIVFCIPFYTLYIVANFYATWFTLIPTSILVGLAAAPLWSAKCSYLTTLSHRYVAIYSNRQIQNGGGGDHHKLPRVEAVNSKFFGLFFAIFHFDAIIGNLISSLTLDSDSPESGHGPAPQCGVDYCNVDVVNNASTSGIEALTYLVSNVTGNLSRLAAQTALGATRELDINSTFTYRLLDHVGSSAGPRQDFSRVYIMCGIYAALSLSGCIVVAIFLRPLKTLSSCTSSLHGWQLLKVSLRQAVNPLQLLMMPLTVFSGLAQSFMTSDFTKAFVSCTIGIHSIGFVMLCSGVTDAIFSLVFGVVLKYVHRSVVYGLGALICLALYITFFSWIPTVANSNWFYVISGFWGVADSVWQTHFNAFYGILFPDNLEVAFASYRLWESIGYLVGFSWSSAVCVKIKLIVLVVLLLVGVLTYGVVEWRLKSRAKTTIPDTNSKQN